MTPEGNRVRDEASALALLERFADAWNRHDLEALMSMMTDDGVFEASAGPEVSGQRSEGSQAVSTAVQGSRRAPSPSIPTSRIVGRGEVPVVSGVRT